MAKSNISLKNLLDAGLLLEDEELICEPRKGEVYKGTLDALGRILYKGTHFNSPSGWAKHVAGNSRDGWRDVNARGIRLSDFQDQLENANKKDGYKAGTKETSGPEANNQPSNLIGEESSTSSHSTGTAKWPLPLADFLKAIDDQQTVRAKLLQRIQNLSGYDFEHLVKKYLEQIEGLQGVKVTKPSGDGDVDVFGYRPTKPYPLGVAAQAKKWTGTTVGSKEIQQFRGAIQGHFSEGIFVTLSKFSSSAIDEASKPGGMHIKLINGEKLFDDLLSHRIGIFTHPVEIAIVFDSISIDENFFQGLRDAKKEIHMYREEHISVVPSMPRPNKVRTMDYVALQAS